MLCHNLDPHAGSSTRKKSRSRENQGRRGGTLRLAIGPNRPTFAFGASCLFSQQSFIRGLDRHRSFEELESWSGQILTVKFEDQNAYTRVESCLQFYVVRKRATEKSGWRARRSFLGLPICFGVTIMNPFLILPCETLPDRRWHLTIAAMPVYI